MAKVVLLTHRSAYATYLAGKTASSINWSAIVVGGKPPQRPGAGRVARLAARMFNPAGWPRMYWQWRIARLERTLKQQAQARELPDLDQHAEFPLEPICFEDVNGPACLDYLRALAPDVMVSYGTSILRPPIISLPRLGIINLHSSLLPHYRGARTDFWILNNREFDKAGITAHFVDPGVDTGDIILQQAVHADERDDFFSLRARLLRAATELLPKAVDLVLSGKAAPIKQPVTSDKPYLSRMVTSQVLRDFYRRKGLL